MGLSTGLILCLIALNACHPHRTIDGDLASLVNKIMREKGNEDKITGLKKQHETPENCTALSETKVNQGVWNNLEFKIFYDTLGSLMDGVLLLANANQKLNYRRRELMRPQLNASYRHLCSPSNPVTSLLFGDDLPKAVKDISDTNRLSSTLTKDTRSTRSARSSQQRTHWQAKRRYDGGRNYNNKQS